MTGRTTIRLNYLGSGCIVVMHTAQLQKPAPGLGKPKRVDGAGERVGKPFLQGNPYISGEGLVYFWHGDPDEYETLFKERGSGIGGILSSPYLLACSSFAPVRIIFLSGNRSRRSYMSSKMTRRRPSQL